MCPAGLKLAETFRHARLLNVVTVGANELYQVGPNSERVGFILASGGGTINFRPTEFGVAVNAGIWLPAATTHDPKLTIEKWGDLILQGWDFTFVNLGNTYQVWEITTGAEWK